MLNLLKNIFKLNQEGGNAAVKRISPKDIKEKVDSGKKIVLLDVRSKEEHRSGHIPNSLLIPVDTIKNNAGRLLSNKDDEIVVYCASGARSSRAARTLVSMGYANVYDMGGIFKWPYEKAIG